MPKLRLKNNTCTILAVLLIPLFNACSSKKVFLNDVNRSLNTVRLAIKYALKGNVRKLSQNSRTYFSAYHVPGMDPNALAVNQKKRARLIITISGNQRPYQLIVSYIIEKHEKGKYSFHHYDKRLAKKYLKKIENYLNSRPKGRDIIDDFRPY